MVPCPVCAKHAASVTFKGLVNDQALKLRLCERCAKKKGLAFPFGPSTLPLSDLVAELMKAASAAGPAPRVCRGCGLTDAEFQQTGQLGCSRCYAVFAPVLEPLLKRLHGSAQHLGKRQPCTVRVPSPAEALNRLKAELQDAVRHEEFERAAALRDELKEFEADLMDPRRRPRA